MKTQRTEPYTKDEERVAKFFAELGIGGGDDPIGALIASHQALAADRNHWRDARKTAIEAGDWLKARAEKAEAALKVMNGVALHQTDRLFEAVGGMPTRVHPLTCGNDSNHTPLYPFWNGEKVQLICRDCDYTQDNSGPVK